MVLLVNQVIMEVSWMPGKSEFCRHSNNLLLHKKVMAIIGEHVIKYLLILCWHFIGTNLLLRCRVGLKIFTRSQSICDQPIIYHNVMQNAD